jgi:hypothetical protein
MELLIIAIAISLLSNLYLILWVIKLEKIFNSNIKILSKFQNDVEKELIQNEQEHKDIAINLLKLMYHRAKEIEDYEFLSMLEKSKKNINFERFS